MLYNQCSHPRCNEEIEKPQKYCDKHKQDKTSNAYIRTRRFTNDKYDKFYSSSEWKRFRKRILARDDYVCQRCKKDGIVKVADLVHHKVEIRDDWTKRLSKENCIAICTQCHERLHDRSKNRIN